MLTEGSSERRPPRLLRIIFGNYADYVLELQPLFIICVFLFMYSITISFSLGNSVPIEVPEELQELLKFIENLSLPLMFLFILFNNIVNSFIWMALGVFFGLPSLYFVIRNGYIIGRVSYNTSLTIGLPITAALLLPHGIIEIPSILLSSAAGMGLGYHLINRLRGKGGLRDEFNKALRFFILRIAPLLLIAAIIETSLIAVSLYIAGAN